ncbi:UNVERIFIED_CONTAM: hypothetical protein HDU68_000371 [Siphonaria sp. JEL0065]|nr:hypothetical protein HDU68_000371 [Siphonaria sp. JEL0065]
MTKINKEHGPVALTTVLGLTLIITSDRDLIHRAYTDNTNFYRDEYTENSVGGVMDNALFVMSTSDKWKRHRKQLQPSFAPAQLRYGLQVTIRETNKLIANWESNVAQSAGKSVVTDLFHEFTCLALDLIGYIAFSQDFHAVEEHHQGKVSHTHEMMKDIGALAQQRTANLPFTWWFIGISSSSPRVSRVRKYVDNLVSNILKTKREAIASGQPGDHVDLLDRLLDVDSSSDQQKFSDAEIVGEVLGFVFAGHETTANSLTFAAMELSQHHEVQQKLKSEIKSILTKCNGVLTVENLAEFKFLDQVVRETQRRHSVVGALTRTTINEVEHDGYVIPAKTPIVLNLADMHVDPKLWEDPFTWNPDRWSKAIASNSFVPFSEGVHNCIGQKLALIEMKVTLILILNKFSFEFVEGQELDFTTQFTYGLKKGLKIKLILDE